MFVKVRVITNSKQEKVEKIEKNEELCELRIHLREKPIHGKANKKIIEILAEYFNVQKKDVVLRKGELNRSKLVEIKNC